MLHTLNHVFTVAVSHLTERLRVCVTFAVLILNFDPESVLDTDVFWHQLCSHLIECQF